MSLKLDAQDDKRIKLIRANAIQYDEAIVRAQRLIGNVVLEHQGSRMYCDSAYLYEASNRFEAFGNVRISDQNELTIRGKRLEYDGDERKAKIYDDITLRDGEMTLTTDYVEYDMNARRASYYEGGKIVSSVNRNVLTSRAGHYFAESKVMHFKDSVILDNPEYDMSTDTLHYHSYNEQAFFLGPTTIVSDDNKIYCENGWYDTQNDKARFGERAHIWSDEQQLLGDSIYYDRVAGYGEAIGNVFIIDTVNSVQISGQYGRHDELVDLSFVTQGALMEQFFDGDTLLLSADTLSMRADTLGFREIFAYHDVLIFKADMQGSCDSLIYTEADSLIRMYESPFIWSDENQISGTHIELRTYEGNVENLIADENAFIISSVDSAHYNQIKGRRLEGLFRDNELYKVDIEGNGESVYYAVEEASGDSLSTDSAARIMGVNLSTCSSIGIYISERSIQRVHFITQPDNAFYPLDKVDPKELILRDFFWNIEARPLSQSALRMR